MEAQNPANQLLSQLRPNHLPEPVGLWPPAAGWWLLAAIVLTLLVLGAGYAYRRWQNNRYRSAALQQARKMFADYHDHQSLQRLVNDANELLKRVALHAFPKSRVAGLNGDAWSRFLADTGDIPELLNHSAFTNDRYNPRTLLAGDPDSAGATPDQVYELTRRWIKKHHA